jgi:tRNA pseudouridine55 synthase
MDGVLVIAKPTGPTSHDVVALIRRLAATKRVGHGGTLDPFASGVLPLFLGRATRLVEYHLGDRKGYRATVCFGASATTDDLEGELTPTDAPAPTRAQLEAALTTFLGPISQRPPAYSAIKVAGRRAYAMARAGEHVELASRDVTIHSLELLEWDDTDPARPIAVVDVECSAGTYIRALARDLGEAVGGAAYLGALVRTASGPFRLDDAVSLERAREAAGDGADSLAALLLPVDAGLDHLPELVVSDEEVQAIARGQFVRARTPESTGESTAASSAGSTALSAAASEGPIRIRDAAGRLIAIATLTDGRLAPDKVLIDSSASAVGA